MTEVSVNGGPSRVADDMADQSDEDQQVDLLGAASAGLGVLGFLTLLRLADRRDRSLGRGLLLWLAATAESKTALLLGAVAITRARRSGAPGRGFLFAAVGVVLGSLSLMLNLNWLRTRRRT